MQENPLLRWLICIPSLLELALGWRPQFLSMWTSRSNQSILKEISPGCSLEGMMLKLKLQYFGHLMRRVDSLEKTDAGRDWGQEEKGTTEDEMAWWHHWLDGCDFEWTPVVGDGPGGLACCDSWGYKESHTTERLNWTELKPLCRAAWISSKHGSQLPLELVIPVKARQKPEYFYDLIPKITRYHFHNSWLVTKISLIHCGRRLYKTQNPGGANYWGAPVILVPTLLMY